jgi:threonine synthase
MKYLSTAGQARPTDLAGALIVGLAPDGGLYVPESLPDVQPDQFQHCETLPQTATQALKPFFAGSELADSLPGICQQALDLPLPLREFEPDQSWLLELFHGPTAAFKDFAARFLATCLGQLRGRTDPIQTVLVATSGDTGGAVAAAFHRRPGFRVVILYPDGRVSARQAHQLGAFGDNIFTYRVQGDFDACQRLVKQALNDKPLARELSLTSANSISIGRLLPQISYYVHAVTSLARQTGTPIDVIIPTGNLGNALACILARDMGLPIGEVVLATNANRTLADFFSGKDYQGQPGLATLANAMDVGDPSNFERLAWFYRERDLRSSCISAVSIEDPAIRTCIQRVYETHGMAICPHTACAIEALALRRAAGASRPHLLVATAHPAKFEGVVEPLLGVKLELPEALSRLLQRSAFAAELADDYETFRSQLLL